MTSWPIKRTKVKTVIHIDEPINLYLIDYTSHKIHVKRFQALKHYLINIFQNHIRHFYDFCKAYCTNNQYQIQEKLIEYTETFFLVGSVRCMMHH